MGKRGNGEGTIAQRSDGRWCGRVMLEGRRRAVYGKTRKEAQDKLRALLADAERGIVISTQVYTLEAFSARWLADVARHNVRPATFKNYSDLLRLYILPHLGGRKLSQLKPEHVQACYSQVLDSGKSTKTVHNAHLALHACLEQAVRWNLVPRNVASVARPPRLVKPEMATLSATDVKRMLTAAAGSRIEALVSLAVNTGMRQSEILGLKWPDVDLDGGSVTVRRQLGRDGKYAEPKTKRGMRTIDLPASAVAALRAHRARQNEERLLWGAEYEGSGLVFATTQGRPLGHRNVDRDFTNLLRKAGVSRVPFHGLRHTYATLLLGQGVPVKVVSEQLGHSTTAMTVDIYGHVIPGMGKDAAAKLDALLS